MGFQARRPCGWLCATAALLCILIPALSLHGHSEWSYDYSFLPEPTHNDGTPVAAKEQLRGEYIAVCLAVRDQGLDLPEFLQHHHYNMGINRSYILDDGSTPALSSFVNTYGVREAVLTFVYYNASERIDSMQSKVYNECATVYGLNHTWLAFIDADEFLDTSGPETLEQILKGLEPLERIGALGVNWQMHTSADQLARAASVRGTYTTCYDDPARDGDSSDNKHIKSIVQARDYDGAVNPHKFKLKRNTVTVGELGDVVDGFAFRQPITRTRVSLHHYAVKSREEYEEKMNRSNAMSQPKGWVFWEHVENKLPHVECREMARWVR